jgi:hypothetical protein
MAWHKSMAWHKPEESNVEIYDVALSFAGKDRSIVEQFAAGLRQRGVTVFYDRFVQSELWGKNLYEYLSDVYSKRSRYCVVFVSSAYAEGDWTRLERRSAQERDFLGRQEFLLPVRLDDTELPGLLSTTGWVDLREQTVSDVVEILCNKLECSSQTHPKLPGTNGRLILELRSNFCSNFKEFVNRSELVALHNSLLELLGPYDARLVGCETCPHRVQIQTNSLGYSRLRTKFLSGELDSATKVTWTDITALEGKERASAPTQTPLARLDPKADSRLTVPANPRQAVCHLPGIAGLDKEANEAISLLGKKTTSDPRQLRAYVTTKDDLLYVHSTFQKEECRFPTKIATNLPVDLLTLFVNLVFLGMPDQRQINEAILAHTKYAVYFINAKQVGRRGDEFYAGAMNIRFV